MKRVQVKIKGVAPLLQHRFPVEEHGINKSHQTKKVYDPEIEAKKCLYQNNQIGIYQPAEHIYNSLIRAGAKFSFEKKLTYKEILKAGISIEPECIPFKSTTPYTIDARPVVVQRARIIRWRPRFEEWELEFEILIMDDKNIAIPVLKEILETAGQSGLGDYRPRFGRFQVVEWKEV